MVGDSFASFMTQKQMGTNEVSVFSSRAVVCHVIRTYYNFLTLILLRNDCKWLTILLCSKIGYNFYVGGQKYLHCFPFNYQKSALWKILENHVKTQASIVAFQRLKIYKICEKYNIVSSIFMVLFLIYIYIYIYYIYNLFIGHDCM